MRFPVAVLLIAMLAGCSSGSATRPADVAQADVRVALRAPIYFGSGTVAPAALDVTVRNSAAVPVRVRRIRLSSPGMLQYEIRPVDRPFNDVLAPGESKSFSIVTEAYASRARLTPSEPLDVRAEIDFEAGGRRYRELFNARGAG